MFQNKTLAIILAVVSLTVAICACVPGPEVPGGNTACSQNEPCSEGFECVSGNCVATENQQAAICGDGRIDDPEVCDDGNTNTEACAYGEVNCTVCNAECENETGATSYCGDALLDDTREGCDDGNEVTEACDYGLTECTVCNSECENEPGALSYCGDGVVDEFEEFCDEGDQTTMACAYGLTQCTVCNAECEVEAGLTSYCGDGILDDSNESCDDGNSSTEACEYGQTACTVCNAECEYEAGALRFCGDNVLDQTYEGCDDGNTSTETCQYGETACTICNSECETEAGATSYCGDTELDAIHESCDDGNANTETCEYGITACSVCNSECENEAGATSYCGDNSIDDGHENCDDGNAVTEECPYTHIETPCTVCDVTCNEAAGATSYCGDEDIDANHEECDAGPYSVGATTDLSHGCPNCQNTVCDGDITVMSSTDDAVNGCNVIDGDLTVQSYYATCTFCTPPSVVVDGIYKVTGSVNIIPFDSGGIGWADGVKEVRLDNITEIGSDLAVGRYEYCPSGCTYRENQQLVSVSFERLASVQDELLIYYNPLLTSMWLPDLAHASSIEINDNPQLCVNESAFGVDLPTLFSSSITTENNKTSGCAP